MGDRFFFIDFIDMAWQYKYIRTSFSLMCGNTYYILKVLANNVNVLYVTYAMYISRHYQKEKILKNMFFSFGHYFTAQVIVSFLISYL